TSWSTVGGRSARRHRGRLFGLGRLVLAVVAGPAGATATVGAAPTRLVLAVPGGPAVAELLGEAVGLVLRPARVQLSDDPPAARPRRLARLADGRAVDGLDIDVGR